MLPLALPIFSFLSPVEGQQAGTRLLSAGQCETSTDGWAWSPDRESACAHVGTAPGPSTAHRAALRDLCMLHPGPEMQVHWHGASGGRMKRSSDGEKKKGPLHLQVIAHSQPASTGTCVWSRAKYIFCAFVASAVGLPLLLQWMCGPARGGG